MTVHATASRTSRAITPTTPWPDSRAASPPTSAAPGRVSSQATAIRRATLQRTSAPSTAEAGAEDAAGRDVGGGQTEAEVGGRQDGRRGRRAGGRTLRRLDLDDALAHGAHDPPATRVGAEADGQTRGQHHPPLRAGAGAWKPDDDQHQGDDAHRLLAVGGAVREGDHRGGERLSVLEAGLAVLARRPAGDPVGERGGRGGRRGRRRSGPRSPAAAPWTRSPSS